MEHYDFILTALTMWREGRGEPLEGRRAILHVLLNRVRDRRWPDTPGRVALQHVRFKNGRTVYQFSCFSPKDPNASVLPAPADPQWLECCQLIDHPGDDPTDGATNYHANYVKPSWAKKMKLQCIIGAHLFYRDD